MLCRRRFLAKIAVVLLTGGVAVGCRHVAQDGRPSPRENRDGGGGGGSGGY